MYSPGASASAAPPSLFIPDAGAPSPTWNEYSSSQIRGKLDLVKKELKTKRGYHTALQDLLKILKTGVHNADTTRLYNWAVQVAHTQALKPGFDPAAALPLFRWAVANEHIFGARSQLRKWAEDVEEASQTATAGPMRRRTVTSPNSSVSSPSPAPAARASNTSPLTSLSSPQMESAASSGLLTTLHQMLLQSSLGSVRSSGIDHVKDAHQPSYAERYPFMQFVSVIVTPFRLPHTAQPALHSVNFTLVAQFLQSVRSNPSHSIRLCTLAASDTNGACIRPPESVTFLLNRRPVLVPPEGPNVADKFFGIPITDLVIAGANQLEFDVRACCCSYSFAVKLVRSATVEALASSLPLRVPMEEALAAVKRSFGGVDDVKELFCKISLNCPITYVRLVRPAKGRTCTHIQCFELNSFLDMNRRLPKWRCPVCSKAVFYEDLLEDPFLQSVLTAAPPNADEAKILPDGTFTFIETTDDDSSAARAAEDEAERKFFTKTTRMRRERERRENGEEKQKKRIEDKEEALAHALFR